MTSQTEIELKFIVPAAARTRLVAEMVRSAGSPSRTMLTARYLDTVDRQLARAGLAWRLRREGQLWIQTLKAGGQNALTRFEHEVVRPDATCDASLHAGTARGDQLLMLLRRAQVKGDEPLVRFQTEVRRTERRIRPRGAVVDVAFDEGRILAADQSLRICELEFELKGGSVSAMLALAERWRQRFGLVYDPRSKAERGDRLACGSPFPPVRKAQAPSYASAASATEAFGEVLDECLAQITHNAIGLYAGNPTLRAEHVHQLRIGIRRLRSALRSFAGWVPAAPVHLVEALRTLFAVLGQARDADVMASGVEADLVRVGAPPLHWAPTSTAPDAGATIAATQTQQALLAWIAWRAALFAPPTTRAPASVAPTPREFHRLAAKRLKKWHARIAADLANFDGMHETALHALRKRIKRQRYALEFFASVLRAREVKQYLRALAALQDQMGRLNDLFVARARYQAMLASAPNAWFALGWLAARIEVVHAEARPSLARLAKTAVPRT